MRSKRDWLLLVGLVAALVAACGKKGPLYLPDRGTAAPAGAVAPRIP